MAYCVHPGVLVRVSSVRHATRTSLCACAPCRPQVQGRPFPEAEGAFPRCFALTCGKTRAERERDYHVSMEVCILNELEVRRTAAKRPLALPLERIILRSTNLAGRWVRITIEFWRSTADCIWMQVLDAALAVGLCELQLAWSAHRPTHPAFRARGARTRAARQAEAASGPRGKTGYLRAPPRWSTQPG